MSAEVYAEPHGYFDSHYRPRLDCQSGYIHQFAQDVKAWGKAIFIRPVCHETNGGWYKNCGPNANPALSKVDCIAACVSGKK